MRKPEYDDACFLCDEEDCFGCPLKRRDYDDECFWCDEKDCFGCPLKRRDEEDEVDCLCQI